MNKIHVCNHIDCKVYKMELVEWKTSDPINKGNLNNAMIMPFFRLTATTYFDARCCFCKWALKTDIEREATVLEASELLQGLNV